MEIAYIAACRFTQSVSVPERMLFPNIYSVQYNRADTEKPDVLHQIGPCSASCLTIQGIPFGEIAGRPRRSYSSPVSHHYNVDANIDTDNNMLLFRSDIRS